jgi:NADPH:quinone reductase-like Zn-dependent oxidoreductase
VSRGLIGWKVRSGARQKDFPLKLPAILGQDVSGIVRAVGRPDASKIREFADDVRDGKFILPVSRRMALSQASKAHALVQAGGAGKIVLITASRTSLNDEAHQIPC